MKCYCMSRITGKNDLSGLEELRKSLTNEADYAIEHLGLSVHTNCDRIKVVLETYLRYFRGGKTADERIRHHLFIARVDRRVLDSFSKPFSPRMERIAGHFGTCPASLSDLEFFQVYGECGHLYFRRGLTKPTIWASLDFHSRSAICLIAEDVRERHWGFRQLFLVIFQEIMKSEGFFPLHAAGVSKDGRGILIIAPAGYGKTTAALLLVRAGFSFLSDDTLFLREKGGGLEILSFPEEVKVLPHMVPFFDELAFLENSVLPEGADKFTFPIERLYGECIQWRATPGILIFLERGDDTAPGLHPMAKKRAMKSFFSQMSLPNANKGALKSYFEILASLTRQCDTYSLAVGFDRGSLPAMIENLLNTP
jgi:hypothetical protein